jgi:hypothetical protein
MRGLDPRIHAVMSPSKLPGQTKARQFELQESRCMTLPRILYAVPQTSQVRIEIAKTIRMLAEHGDERLRQRRPQIASMRREFEEIAREVRKLSREWPLLVRSELRKAGFDPNEPRVPAGNPGGGQWTSEAGNGNASDPRVLSDATPDNNSIPGAQYAANDPPGIGHNQGPPLEEPPEIPPQPPVTKQAINDFLKAAAYWLAEALLVDEPAGALYLTGLRATEWLADNYLPYIIAYLDGPKTLAELQQDLSSQLGYNIHHIVEWKSAKDDGFPESMYDAPENLVRMPTLTHWLITGWYMTKNDEFGGVSPRDYLRGKSWDERVRVGKIALILYGVLEP